MTPNKKYVIACLLVSLLYGMGFNVGATHISKPVLIEPKTQYLVGEKVVINGWVDYNAQPTADVLLNFRVTAGKGTLIAENSYSSDKQGHFQFELDTRNLQPGTYTITITSHCLEIHRDICSYNDETLTFDLDNPY
ncbi:hypothetical protein SAMN05421690_100687 [Nitrosomonas sp. Nm51]|uniref:hypothetical protein n=1 Tax=Nitrosomonas sp. Nm51 TaxID=133720 RepID=UPI0008C03EBE|nr:hypothetical protein [Nitrosomonas sp. Nm51]SER04612.1 hypothetical protein SAMN05421690_100687 [Nitrosomonas sp. Nm51]